MLPNLSWPGVLLLAVLCFLLGMGFEHEYPYKFLLRETEPVKVSVKEVPVETDILSTNQPIKLHAWKAKTSFKEYDRRGNYKTNSLELLFTEKEVVGALLDKVKERFPNSEFVENVHYSLVWYDSTRMEYRYPGNVHDAVWLSTFEPDRPSEGFSLFISGYLAR